MVVIVIIGIFILGINFFFIENIVNSFMKINDIIIIVVVIGLCIEIFVNDIIYLFYF